MTDNVKTLSKECPNCGKIFVPSEQHKNNGWDSLMDVLSRLNIDGMSGDEFFVRDGLLCSEKCRIEFDKRDQKNDND